MLLPGQSNRLRGKSNHKFTKLVAKKCSFWPLWKYLRSIAKQYENWKNWSREFFNNEEPENYTNGLNTAWQWKSLGQARPKNGRVIVTAD